MGPMNFSEALYWLKQGKRMTRTGWYGACQWIALQQLDENSKISLPYFYIKTAQGDLAPWLDSQTDLLANDWIEAEETE